MFLCIVVYSDTKALPAVINGKCDITTCTALNTDVTTIKNCFTDPTNLVCTGLVNLVNRTFYYILYIIIQLIKPLFNKLHKLRFSNYLLFIVTIYRFYNVQILHYPLITYCTTCIHKLYNA